MIQHPTTQPPNHPNIMKILIADDELVSRKKMERLIQSLGYETIVAENGTDAWNIWKNERPRMLITDWMMPGISGTELCRKIRAASVSQYTYLIMVSAKTDVHDLVEGMEAGADDFISKPFIKEELAVRIRAGERVLNFELKDIVIFSMAKLAESRYSGSELHLERIRFYSKILAQAAAELDEPPEEINSVFIDQIFLTSPLHDIGKIGIPDHILMKQGRLDDQEFEIMKTHTLIGFETLHEALKRYPKADYLKMSADIARSHHENFDGTGYPDRLKGADIPLSARIVSLADAYDILVSRKMYKAEWAYDMARSVIIHEKGTHFDPMLVEVFLSCESSFIEIYNHFN
jgi:putative two-component system response regulator